MVLNIVDRYLGRAVLTGILVTYAVLLPLIGFVLIGDELDEVGQGRYHLADAFLYVALTLPSYAYQLLPYAALIGSLLGLGTLAGHSELIALRALGMSLLRIAGSIAKTGLVLVLFAVFLGEWLAPKAEESARIFKSSATEDKITLKSRYGFWARDGLSFINIREVVPGGTLKDIFIYEFDAQYQLITATHADRARFQGDHWELHSIQQSHISFNAVTTTTHETGPWGAFLDPGLLRILVMEPNLLPVWSLYQYITFMRDNGQNPALYALTFWKRVALPLKIAAMLLLTLPLLFGSQRHFGAGQRVFWGVSLGILFYILDQITGHMALVYGFSPLLATLIPLSLALVLASHWLRQV